jgi:hypothetical protein
MLKLTLNKRALTREVNSVIARIAKQRERNDLAIKSGSLTLKQESANDRKIEQLYKQLKSLEAKQDEITSAEIGHALLKEQIERLQEENESIRKGLSKIVLSLTEAS